MYFPEILLHIINTSVFQLHALFVKAVIRCNNYIEQFRSTFNLSSFYIILDRTDIIPSLQPFRFSYALNLNEANVFSSSCSALASALILIKAQFGIMLESVLYSYDENMHLWWWNFFVVYHKALY